MSTILCLDDDPDIRLLVTETLEGSGFEVTCLPEARDLAVNIAEVNPDLIVLDWLLPGSNGGLLCKELRRSGVSTPIVFLTACDATHQIVEGFECGADDYIVKPFLPQILVARIRARLRVHTTERCPRGLKLDHEGQIAFAGDQQLDLTATEYRMLAYLASNRDAVKSRNQIITGVMGRLSTCSERTVDVHVNALRRKLGPMGSCIQTVRGMGYRLDSASLAGECPRIQSTSRSKAPPQSSVGSPLLPRR